MRSATGGLALTCLFLGLAGIGSQAEQNSDVAPVYAGDVDGDGLDDGFEQALLARFLPTFRISADDCDSLPAEFVAWSRQPVIIGRNGTIYGQVFRNSSGRGTGAFLEVHYYHLWARDCGRRAHGLDAEHVSVLIKADTLGESPMNWKAVYWYAATHKETVCDASHGARAAVLGAVDRGPDVWISSGKHASFLDRSLCGAGCGADRCELDRPLDITKLINIGEPGAPMNGATWSESNAWTLLAKMKTNFSAESIVQLEAAPSHIVPLNSSRASTRGVISAGNSVFDALSISDRSIGTALSSSSVSVEGAIASGLGHTAASLKRARGAVAQALRLRAK